jgi:Kef-type K+ transport system membrane component KefB
MDFLVTLSILIIVATIMTYIFNRLNQPHILAFIVTGILIGPLVFGWVQNTKEIILLSEIGIAFLLFSVGISTNLNHLKKIHFSVFLLPIINILIFFGLLFLFQNILYINFVQILYLSLILSFSSTMLVAKMLMDNFEMSSLYGKISIGILLVEDIIAILAIPILKNIYDFSGMLILIVILKVLLLVILAYILNKFIYPKLIKHTFESAQSFFILTIGSCFLFIFVSYLLQFDIAVGAFIGGLAISIFPYNLEISNKIFGLKNLLSMIFFVSLGMQLSFSFSEGVPLLLVILILFIYLLKPFIHFIILLFSGYGARISIKVTIILAQISEFSLILAMQGWVNGQIPQTLYSAIIIVTSISMLLTPYLYKYSSNIYNVFFPIFKKFNIRHFNRKVNNLKHISRKLNDHLIIVGSDVVGDAVRKILGRDNNIDILIVDHDPEKITPLIKNKLNAICGDINNEEVINSLDLKKAKSVILTLPKFDSTIRFLKKAKNINPDIIIYTRAANKKEALNLYQEGADLVIIPKVLESNFLLEKINVLIQKGPDRFAGYKSVYIDYLKRDIKK